jgi:hypothetical protein
MVLMTEAEWLASEDPEVMLIALMEGAPATSPRKLRLFAVACGRHSSEWTTDPQSLSAIKTSEQYADGLIGRKKLAAARRDAFAASKAVGANRIAQHAAVLALNISYESDKASSAFELARTTAGCASSLWYSASGPAGEPFARRAQTDLLRDIIGNPFRPVALDPAWRTTAVLGLAEAIYADRAFDRLPILADALEEAGCANADLLDHCRGLGPHVRGCWAVDLILGKA